MREPYEITLSIVERKHVDMGDGKQMVVITRSREGWWKYSQHRTRALLSRNLQAAFNDVAAEFLKQKRKP